MKNRALLLFYLLLFSAGTTERAAGQQQSLTTQSNSVGPVPQQGSAQQPQPATNLIQSTSQVVDPTQVRDVVTRVGLLESERTWVIGLTAGLGIGIALVVWLRKDIVRTLVSEAFPNGALPISGSPPKRWYPNKAQWIVAWIATTLVSPLFVFFSAYAIALRIAIVVVANAILFLVCFSDH